MALIYKIVSRGEWELAASRGVFDGAPVDIADGFIHFSTAAQVIETAARHFAGKGDLLLIGFEAESLGPDLKWEPSRGGDLFPHLYASLPTALATRVAPLPLGSSGLHDFSGLLA